MMMLGDANFDMQLLELAGDSSYLSARSLAEAAIVTLFFGVIARKLRGVSRSGTAAGVVICFLLYAGAGAGAFAALVSVFVLTWLATRVGYEKKRAIGAAEPLSGRTAVQVVANLGAAASCALLYAVSGKNGVFLVGLAAALAEAAGDTVSSEVGQARSDQAILITTWKTVPSGTDGAVSLIGTVAGTVAAALVSSVCVVTKLLPLRWFGASLLGAVIGIFADSYMGALWERRRLLNNEAVNSLSTLIAALVAGMLVAWRG
jgi:uncharacterized protein (TIGR00297 family)